MALRPWSPIPIHECGEPLVTLPHSLWRLEPHPYRLLGAPYGPNGDPFRLREGVVDRLLQAEETLQADSPGMRLAVFDAWRPLGVQRFMVRHALVQECDQQGVNPDRPSGQRDRIEAEVGRFWAPPSEDPATPPPHSTGAAVDLTLAEANGTPCPMGGAIDAIGAISEPQFYRAAAQLDPDSASARWHRNRQLLNRVMASAGFVQHPNEWWHFSWGDQLWAWRSGSTSARYGRVGELESSLIN
jgi:D-alanyl-D-alanine dipeptidase